MSTYEISKSSLLSLKAEILRKHEEVNKTKLQNENKIQQPKKVLDVKNKGLEQRICNDTVEDEDLLKKSRTALEAKAKLYDLLSKGTTKFSEEEKEFNKRYLVHFNKKSSRNHHFEELVDDDVEEHFSDEYEPATNPDEEWVEYTDCLGRTRKCLRKDLSTFKSRDAELKESIGVEADSPERESNHKKIAEPEEANSPSKDDFKEDGELLSQDMRRELLRQQWEKEEQELQNKSDTHYQDLLYNEARAHGVAYYGFSKDEDERARQQEALKKLRVDTEQQQKKAQELKALREKQLAARTKAARNRRRERMGLPPEENEPEKPTEHKEVPSEVVTTAEKSKEEKDKELTRKKHIRPWDMGKEGVKKHYEYSQEEWVDRQRKERIKEFAPPTAYRRNFHSTEVKEIPEADKSLYFSTKYESKSKKLENLNPYKPEQMEVRTPIINECVNDHRKTDKHNLHTCSSSSEESDSDDKHRGKGVEIAPPPTFEYYGPSSKKRKTVKGKEKITDSIAAGLKFLREQSDSRKPSNRRDSDMFLM